MSSLELLRLRLFGGISNSGTSSKSVAASCNWGNSKECRLGSSATNVRLGVTLEDVPWLNFGCFLEAHRKCAASDIIPSSFWLHECHGNLERRGHSRKLMDRHAAMT